MNIPSQFYLFLGNQGSYYNASNYENGGYYSNPDVMCATEKSRQAAITELYDTEESYMADMSIVLEVSCECRKKSSIFCTQGGNMNVDHTFYRPIRYLLF